MILSRISDYLQINHRAALHDMASGLDVEPGALRDILSTLERKGRVRKLSAGTVCDSGCCKCSPDSIELYEWIGRNREVGDAQAARIEWILNPLKK